jgi:hypothetical protein
VKHVFNSRDSLYRPLYSPWFGESVFLSHYKKCAARTLVSQDRCYILFKTLQQSLSKEGDVMECGVYKGGTALLIATKSMFIRGSDSQFQELPADVVCVGRRVAP